MTTITEPWMTSVTTPHRAKRIAIRNGREYWRASWLPEQILTRQQALSAMAIAELAAGNLDRHMRQTIVCLAAELDLTGPEAACLAAGEPHDLDRRFHDMSIGCWCEPELTLAGVRHRRDDRAEVAFAASEGDAIDAAGRPTEMHL